MKKQPAVFLSYAREDRSRVEDIYHGLSVEGFKPWMDAQDIRAGSEWSKVITEAIQHADFVLVFISQNSVSKRGFIQREIKAALSVLSERPEGEIFLIPVRLDESDLPAGLRDIQAVDLFMKDGWKRLLKSLKHAQQGGVPIAETEVLKEDIKRERREEQAEMKPHVFVAMPFSVDMEDIYYYGIQSAVHANGFQSERVDLIAFTGDILEQIRSRIETAVAVIAELTSANPNVHLELGYAWGKNVPTILVLRDGEELSFDVRGQRCLKYRNIKNLQNELTEELARLRTNGTIGTLR